MLDTGKRLAWSAARAVKRTVIPESAIMDSDGVVVAPWQQASHAVPVIDEGPDAVKGFLYIPKVVTDPLDLSYEKHPVIIIILALVPILLFIYLMLVDALMKWEPVDYYYYQDMGVAPQPGEELGFRCPPGAGKRYRFRMMYKKLRNLCLRRAPVPPPAPADKTNGNKGENGAHVEHETFDEKKKDMLATTLTDMGSSPFPSPYLSPAAAADAAAAGPSKVKGKQAGAAAKIDDPDAITPAPPIPGGVTSVSDPSLLKMMDRSSNSYSSHTAVASTSNGTTAVASGVDRSSSSGSKDNNNNNDTFTATDDDRSLSQYSNNTNPNTTTATAGGNPYSQQPFPVERDYLNYNKSEGKDDDPRTVSEEVVQLTDSAEYTMTMPASVPIYEDGALNLITAGSSSHAGNHVGGVAAVPKGFAYGNSSDAADAAVGSGSSKQGEQPNPAPVPRTLC